MIIKHNKNKLNHDVSLSKEERDFALEFTGDDQVFLIDYLTLAAGSALKTWPSTFLGEFIAYSLNSISCAGSSNLSAVMNSCRLTTLTQSKPELKLSNTSVRN